MDDAGSIGEPTFTVNTVLAMKMADTANKVDISIMKKSMDVQKQAMMQLISQMTGVGGNIDTTA